MKRLTKKFLLALIPGSFVLGLTGCDVDQAPDSGTWRGQVTYSDGIYQPTSCEVKLDTSHNDKTLRIYHLESSCNQFTSRWSSVSFDVHGDELWKGNQLVGHASPNGTVSFELENPYLDDRYPYPANRVVVSWNRSGNFLEFTETAYFDGRVQRSHGWLRQESSGSISWDVDARISD